jgi:hypothetical protein
MGVFYPAELPKKCVNLTRAAVLHLFIGCLIAASTLTHAAAPDYSWVQQPSSSGDVFPRRLATDRCGNTYAVGLFIGDTVFGTNSFCFESLSGYSFFLTKLDRNGSWVWTRSLPTANPSNSYLKGSGVAVDASNNIVVTGLSVAFGGDGSTSTPYQGTNVLTLLKNEIFVAKFSENGDLLWARPTGGADADVIHGVCVDAGCNIFLDGFSQQGDVTTNDFFLLKLDPSGNELMRVRPDYGYFATSEIRLDASGNIYICGQDQPPASVRGFAFTNNVSNEGFLLKLNPAGSLLWVRQTGETPNDEFNDAGVTSFAVDLKSNIIVCGFAGGDSLFGVPIATNSTAQMPFTAKFNACGTNLWIHVVRGGGSGPASGLAAEASSVVVDPAGNAYVAGMFTGTAQFDGTTLVAGGYSDAFLAMCDSSGAFRWATRAGGADPDDAQSLCIGKDGLVMTGFAGAFSSFGSITSSYADPGGYFAGITFPAPQLQIALSGTNVTLSWPPMPSGFQLQCTTNLAEAVWQTSNAVPDVAGGNYRMTFDVSGNQEFFRLYRPMP